MDITEIIRVFERIAQTSGTLDLIIILFFFFIITYRSARIFFSPKIVGYSKRIAGSLFTKIFFNFLNFATHNPLANVQHNTELVDFNSIKEQLVQFDLWGTLYMEDEDIRKKITENPEAIGRLDALFTAHKKLISGENTWLLGVCGASVFWLIGNLIAFLTPKGTGVYENAIRSLPHPLLFFELIIFLGISSFVLGYIKYELFLLDCFENSPTKEPNLSEDKIFERIRLNFCTSNILKKNKLTKLFFFGIDIFRWGLILASVYLLRILSDNLSNLINQ